MRVLFLFLGLSVVLLAILCHSSLAQFIHLPSLLFVGVITALLTLPQHGVSGTIASVRAALSGQTLSQVAVTKYGSTLATIRVLALSTGVVGTMISVVKMLAQMDDPNRIGQAMAVAMLPTFYGLVIGEMIVRPLERSLNRPQGPMGTASQTLPKVMSLLGVSIVLIVAISGLNQVPAFVDGSGLLVAIVAPLFLCLVCYSPRQIRDALRVGLGRNQLSLDSAQTQIKALSTIRMITMSSGLAGMLIGTIIMLHSMSDPSKIGPAMALVILAPLYATAVSEWCLRPMIVAMPKRVHEADQLKLEHAGSNLGMMTMPVMGVGFAFCILLVSL